MLIEKVAAFKTSDGRYFENLDEAFRHEVRYRVRQELARFQDDAEHYGHHLGVLDDLAEFIAQNRMVFTRILQGHGPSARAAPRRPPPLNGSSEREGERARAAVAAVLPLSR